MTLTFFSVLAFCLSSFTSEYLLLTAVLNIVLLVRLSENANVKARLSSSNLRVSSSVVFNCNTRLTFCVALRLNPRHRSLSKISTEIEFRGFF